MNDTLLQLGGRLHPLLLHLPLGVLGALLMLELWGLVRRRALDRGVRLLMLWFLALSAGISVASGIQLSQEQAYIGDTVELHRWFGITTASSLLVAAILATMNFRRAYVAAMIVAVGIIIPTGHFGASMTHGPDFLTSPFTSIAERSVALVSTDPTQSWYEAQIAPILEARCVTCHGPRRRKRGLSLHTPAAIAAGGESGSILAADDGGAGLMAWRIGLPRTDDDHMPPDHKPQLLVAQIQTLVRWIEAGAPFDEPPPHGAVATETVEPVVIAARPELSREALANLQAAHVHVEVIDPESSLLWIDFGATPDMPVEDVSRLLRPLAPFTSELSLRGMNSANQVLATSGPWEQLRQLDLSYAGVDRDGLAAATQAQTLTELTLVGANLSAQAAEHILSVESLQQLHVWDSNIPVEIIEQLRDHRPALAVNEGSVDVPAPLEVEPEFKPGPPAIVATLASLTPVNSVCPVSGDPVDPKFAIVYEGQVVGFCCEQCPGRFWADPSAFLIKADRAID